MQAVPLEIIVWDHLGFRLGRWNWPRLIGWIVALALVLLLWRAIFWLARLLGAG